MEHSHKHHSTHNLNIGRNNKSIFWIVIVFVVIIAIALIIFVSQNQNRETSERGEPVSLQCAFFCDTNQKTGFCSFQIQVNKNLRTTCQELSTNPAYTQYNVATCPTISCVQNQQELDQTCVSGLGGTWETAEPNGECKQFGSTIRRKLNPSDQPPLTGQICCR